MAITPLISRLEDLTIGPPVNVRDRGAKGDGVANDTAAIQAAIDTGLPLYFPPGDYLCDNLTQSTDFQKFFGMGALRSRLIKRANGPLLTCAGNYVRLESLGFRGDAASPTFTGDNLLITGDHPMLIDCGSRWAHGRALKATGHHVQVFGTGDIYQTADATATGYDIEIGTSGTLTPYHELHGIYSSQSTGGILLVDTGSHTIAGGQFGKLTIDKGTGPAGTNGGKTLGARILGDVTVEASSALFAGNQFGAVVITFTTGVSGCRLGPDNTLQVGATVVNNGTTNLILRSDAANALTFGQDSSSLAFSADPGNGQFIFPKIRLDAAGGVRGRNAADSADGWRLLGDASDNIELVNATTDKVITIATTGTGSGSRTQIQVNGVTKVTINNTGITVNGALDHDGTTVGFFGTAPATQQAANADTSGAALVDLETEVNQLKAVLRAYGLIAT